MVNYMYRQKLKFQQIGFNFGLFFFAETCQVANINP